ncbi:MAG: HD domain-containing protein [Brevinema sp.]
MIRKSLIVKLFDGFTMQRWNDQLRPTELVEMDKQGHAACLAYFLARSIEEEEQIDMQMLMEQIVFHYLERIIITDIKPPVFSRISSNHSQYTSLRNFVKDMMLPYLEGLPPEFIQKFIYWCEHPYDKIDTLTYKILEIAKADATLWEFDLLVHANPNGFGITEIAHDMENLKNKHIELRRHLVGKLETKHIREESKTNLFTDENYSSYTQLVKMFGQMRFQVRWAQLYREPKTSVLGHSFYVALLSYFFSLSAGACSKRLYNNFFTAVFHDLPEVFTRDIISPLKRDIAGFGDLIKEIEQEEMERKFKMLIPEKLRSELFYFITDEFADQTMYDKKIKSYEDGIPAEFNQDKYNPRDGSLVRLSDYLGAYLEADMALNNGATSSEFITAKERIKMDYSTKKIAGLELKSLFLDFK